MENKKYNYHEELRQIAPNLSEIEKKQVLSVPDDYFSDLSNRINDRITAKSNEKLKAVHAPLWNYLYAAVFSVLILTITFIYFNREKNNTAVAEIEISADDLIASAYLLGVDEYYIKETVANSEADLNVFVDNSEFEDYLLDQGIDEHLITNEL